MDVHTIYINTGGIIYSFIVTMEWIDSIDGSKSHTSNLWLLLQILLLQVTMTSIFYKYVIKCLSNCLLCGS